jgi:outer membrane receptor protein involved in Fe transport
MGLRRVAVFLLLGVVISRARAVGATPGDGEAEREEEGEAGVAARRPGERAFDTPRAVEVTGQSRVGDLLTPSPPKVLEEELGLFVEWESGVTGTPFLRGLGGGHVQLLVDGFRLSSALTPFGTDPRVGWIDRFRVQRIEVLRGPAVVLYGAGATAGVIDLLTRSATFDPRRAWDASARLVGGARSADAGLVSHLALDGHLGPVGLRLGGSLKRFGDLQGGGETGRQPFTGYWEGDADLSAAWAPGATSWLRLSYAALRRHDASLPRQSSATDYRRVTDELGDALAVRYSARLDGRFIRSIDAGLSYQSQREQRDRFQWATGRDDREHDAVSTLGLQVSLASEVPRNRVSYGLDLYHDWVTSSAEEVDISGGSPTSLARGRHVDGSRQLETGVYLLDDLSLGKKLVLEPGVRLSIRNVDIPAAPAPLSQALLRSTETTVAGSLHGRYLLGEGLNLVAGVSQGYRAPNVDDLSALGCGELGYDLPSPGVKSEKSISAEAGVKLDVFGIVRASLFYFFTYLSDPITLVPEPGSAAGTVAGAAACGGALRRGNADSGRVQGVEGSVALALGRRWEIFASGAWARGDLSHAGTSGGTEPLSRVPPAHGLGGVRYQTEDGKSVVELRVRWSAPGRRLGGLDQQDPGICPAGLAGCRGTDGYAVLTARGAFRLFRALRVFAALDNLTNASYRAYGSSFDGTGLSGVLGMELLVR